MIRSSSMAEQVAVNDKVLGSSPSSGVLKNSTNSRFPKGAAFLFLRTGALPSVKKTGA